MNPSPLHLVLIVASVAALARPADARAAEEPYRDAAQARAEAAKIVACDAKREEFMRMGSALTPLYDGDPAQPALAGWRKVEEANALVAMFDMPEPITVYGHSTKRLMMAGESLFAVLDGDLADALSKQLKLAAGEEPLAQHIRLREVRREPIGDGVVASVTQTVSTLTTHPGKTMVGCEYKMVW